MNSTLEAADLFDRLIDAGVDYTLLAEFVNKQLGTDFVYIGDGQFEEPEASIRNEREPNDSMDGDFDSGMASAGHGTDEQYEHGTPDGEDF